MKKNKKAFTLVELLVVIAILAILATVSILGYTSFTGKAKASNAEQELSQMKTMLLADWLDGFVGEADKQIAITKGSTGYTVNQKYKEDSTDKDVNFALLIKAFGDDVDTKMSGLVSFKCTEVEAVTSGDNQHPAQFIITEVVYESANGYTAVWDIAKDTIKATAGSKTATGTGERYLVKE